MAKLIFQSRPLPVSCFLLLIGILAGSPDACGHGVDLTNHDGKGLFRTHYMEVMGHLPVRSLGGDSPITSEEYGDLLVVNDIWGWTDPATNNEYALVGRSDGTAFVNVTDPRRPVFLGMLPSQSWNSLFRDIKTFRNHAYIVSDGERNEDDPHGIQVFDLTRLRGLTAAPAEYWTADAVHQEINRSHNVAINPESGLLSTAPPGFEVATKMFDLDPDPLKLAPVGEFRAFVHDMQIISYRGPDLRYQNQDIMLSFNGGSGGWILDPRAAAGTRLIANLDYPDTAFMHQGWVTEDHRFLLANDESDEKRFNSNTRTHLWNIETLDRPIYLGFHEHDTDSVDHNLYVKGNNVYQANYSAGLRVLDLGNIADGKLTQIGYVSSPTTTSRLRGAFSTYPFFESGTIIYSDTDEGLIIARLALDDVPGDFDGDDDFDHADVNALMFAIDGGNADPRFDLNDDEKVDRYDLVHWVKEIKGTTFGDANLDGHFTTSDLVQVFAANQYEDEIEHNSLWQTGDWNADGEFESGDLIEAYADGGYNSQSQKVIPVPEPAGPLSTVFLCCFFLLLGHNRKATE